MKRIHREATMRASPERIWGVLEDIEGMVGWLPDPPLFPRAVKVEHIEGPRGPGGLRRVTLKNGKTLEERFTHWEPPRRQGYTLERDTLGVRRRMKSYQAFIELGPRGDGTTRVVYRAEMETRGLGGLLLGPILGRVLGSVFQGSLENIRGLVEKPG